MDYLQQEYETLLVSEKDGICTIMMNRPEVLNAMNPQMFMDLGEVISGIEEDERVKVVIITGAGETFSSGGDVRQDIEPLHRMTVQEFENYVRPAHRFIQQIMDMEKIVIAAINGTALGFALDLSMVCDIRIASEKAQFSMWFVRMGFTPIVGAYLLPRLVGIGRAKLLACTGDIIDAKEAERIGLVETVVPHDKLMESAESLAKKFMKRPLKAVGIIKKEINTSLSMDLSTSLDYHWRLFYQCLRTEDHAEVVNAWIEKRKPVLTGR